TSSAFVDGTVTNGTEYFYVVRAEDTSGNESGNSNEDSATPMGGGGATTLHVQSILLETVNVGGGNKVGRATVTIVDNLGNPVSGADVSGTFTGDYDESHTETTNGSGVAVLTTTGTKKGNVSFMFCVDDVVHGALSYDDTANVITCDNF
ncbi:MAG: hypothetical protein O7D94_12520, partial [Planctomycetota bacterium]|nr:hypothetical protein [Planctomycetota bacterium]